MTQTKRVLKDIIIEQLGIGSLSRAEQDEIVSGISGNVLQAITIAVLERVPKEARPTFDNLKMKGDRAALKAFLEQYVEDIDTLVQEEVKKCIQEFKTIVASL